MSAKDLNTIGFLDQIVDAGVDIIKIEGRARPAEYVDRTVRCYKEALDAVAEKTYTEEKIKAWNERLTTVFNRGFWDGYYMGRKMGEWNETHGSKATERKVYIGKINKYFAKVNVGEFYMETNSLKEGDQILISGPTTGVVNTTVKELRVEDEKTGEVKKGMTFSMPIAEVVRPSDKLYKILKVE
jgi:putative protease